MYKYKKDSLEIYFVNYACRLLLSFCKASKQLAPCVPPKKNQTKTPQGCFLIHSPLMSVCINFVLK